MLFKTCESKLDEMRRLCATQESFYLDGYKACQVKSVRRVGQQGDAIVTLQHADQYNDNPYFILDNITIERYNMVTYVD